MSTGTGPLRVLVVDDEPAIRRFLRAGLSSQGYVVSELEEGLPAVDVARRKGADLIVLDLGLPDIDGTEVIVELRRWYKAPIIVLSGRTSPGDKIGALDVGADDYVTKPFAMAELLARLRAALRRDESGLSQDQPRQVIIGRWLVDLTARQVRRAREGDQGGSSGSSGSDGSSGSSGSDGAGGAGDGSGGAEGAGGAGVTLRLTPTEWRILTILLDRPGQLVGSVQLLTEVWGPGFQQRTSYLRFHMARLRRKLEENPSRPRHLLTEPGMGYRYQP